VNVIEAPACPYCGKPSHPATGREIYPHRPDLWGRGFFACTPCDAYVGTHRDTGKPLGTLANAPTRAARQAAHAAFDPLWKHLMSVYEGVLTKKVHSVARTRAYAWLADQMGYENRADCHIAAMSIEQAQRVVQIIREKRPTAASIRHWWKNGGDRR